VTVEVGGAWPFPREWGRPTHVPPEALESSEAASRFLASWAAGKIRERQGRRSGRRLPGWEALALLEERIRRENLHRLELLRLKTHGPL
jgi:hypothetical protein